MTREKAQAGELFEHPWLMDSAGRPTCDPTVMESATNRGSLLLLGGYEAGHKGFGLALMVEALTQGLSGHGRLDAPTRWGASVYLQVIDPEAFAGRQAFIDQMDFFADRCHANAPIDPERPVRLPGEQASRNIAEATARGVALSPETTAALRRWAERLGISAAPLPEARAAMPA
jgi:L-lactate dehydrogenase